MVAATKNRNTPTRAGHRRGHPAAAGVLCLAGTIAVMNASGYAEPASTTTDLITLGVFSAELDNAAGGDGDQVAEIERGFFQFANDDSDPVARTQIGTPCYLVDNQTVAATDGSGTRSPAGIVDDVDDQGVWVLLDPTA
ncbi:hypothetical protein FZZ93_02440 [Halomonas eurihalina]|uniref:Uncharacterized protein n=1 Tax=Halomonas eurihalina TaxID=42566 RepID=A0A5D9DEL0_HALER|nr:hypothetical protein [Halomonas eurihalina]MDR5857947.1 hypothetical protein [Halomonas eurihalina]TZG41540.1 hypothetical protein FZZ93_02440 [Halomonas eurihalina]